MQKGLCVGMDLNCSFKMFNMQTKKYSSEISELAKRTERTKT